jgi:hypothetical protein
MVKSDIVKSVSKYKKLNDKNLKRKYKSKKLGRINRVILNKIRKTNGKSFGVKRFSRLYFAKKRCYGCNKTKFGKLNNKRFGFTDWFKSLWNRLFKKTTETVVNNISLTSEQPLSKLSRKYAIDAADDLRYLILPHLDDFYVDICKDFSNAFLNSLERIIKAIKYQEVDTPDPRFIRQISSLRKDTLENIDDMLYNIKILKENNDTDIFCNIFRSNNTYEKEPTNTPEYEYTPEPEEINVLRNSPNKAIVPNNSPNKAIVPNNSPNKAIVPNNSPNKAIVPNNSPEKVITANRVYPPKESPSKDINKRISPANITDVPFKNKFESVPDFPKPSNLNPTNIYNSSKSLSSVRDNLPKLPILEFGSIRKKPIKKNSIKNINKEMKKNPFLKGLSH